MGFKDLIKKDFIIWYMIVSTAMNVWNMVFYYNHPEFGFADLGIGVILTAIFPVIWVIIYVYCKLKKSNEEEAQK